MTQKKTKVKACDSDSTEGFISVTIKLDPDRIMPLQGISDIYHVSVASLVRLAIDMASPALVDLFKLTDRAGEQMRSFVEQMVAKSKIGEQNDAILKSFSLVKTRIEQRQVEYVKTLDRINSKYESEVTTEVASEAFKDSSFFEKMGLPEPTDNIEETKPEPVIELSKNDEDDLLSVLGI